MTNPARIAESPLNGPWSRVFANSFVEVRYREHPREKILVVERPGGNRSTIRTATFALELLDRVQMVFGWIFDKLGFHAGRLPPNLDFDRTVRLLKDLITKEVKRRTAPWTPELRAAMDHVLAAMPQQRDIGALQFLPPNRTEIQLIGQDFSLWADPTYFTAQVFEGSPPAAPAPSPAASIGDRGALSALALHTLLTGSDVARVRRLRQEVESLRFDQLGAWLSKHEIPFAAQRSASRQGAETLNLAGRGFALEVSASSFEASSTLAQDVEESFTVSSPDKEAAARLWGILRDEGDTSLVANEVEQLDFAELPGWLRKQGVRYDLDRHWQEAAPRSAGLRVAVPLGGRWSGSIANPNAEVRWSTRAGHETIVVVEMPQKGMRKVRVATFNLNYGPTGLFASNVLQAAGMTNGLPPSATYDKVRDDLARALVRDAEREAANPRAYYRQSLESQIPRWHQHPYWEESINARLVLPASSPEVKIPAKDFTFVIKPYEFSARKYYSDPHDMEPSYVDIGSTSPWMALSLYKQVTGPAGPQLEQKIQSMSWNDVGKFLNSLKIAFSQHSSVRRASRGDLVLSDRAGRTLTVPRSRLGGFRPDEVLLHAGFEYGVPPSRTLRQAAQEVDLAVGRLSALAGIRG